MNRNPLKTLRNKCDKLTQQVGLLNHPTCVGCGNKRAEVLHHFFPKSKASALRYDLTNCVPVCNACHLAHHTGDPVIHKNIIEYYGDEWYDELRERKNKITKISKGYYQNVKESLEKLL